MSCRKTGCSVGAQRALVDIADAVEMFLRRPSPSNWITRSINSRAQVGPKGDRLVGIENDASSPSFEVECSIRKAG